MKILLIYIFLTLISCKERVSSNLNEEGFTRVENRTYDEILKQLDLLYRFSDQEKKLLKTHLKKVILSTFRIQCDSVSGTGFFIGTKGSFISVGHVIDEGKRDCTFSFAEEMDAGRFGVKKRVHSVEITAGAYNVDIDLSYGRVIGATNNNFLGIVKKIDGAVSDKRNLVVGFPVDTLRDGTMNEEDKRKYDFIFNDWLCGQDYSDRLVMKYINFLTELSKNLSKNEVDSMAENYQTHFLSELSIRKSICKYQQSKSEALRVSGYDQVKPFEALGMYISIGRTIVETPTKIISDADMISGNSGGPIVNFSNGLVRATVISGIVPLGEESLKQRGYFPDLIGQKVSIEALKFLKATQSFTRNACLCDANVMQRSATGADTTLLKTNILYCIPENISEQRSKDFCADGNILDRGTGYKSPAGLRTYLNFSNCHGPVSTNTKSCFFLPGVPYKVKDPQGMRSTIVIDPKVMNYFSEYDN